jgi:hypothetical protein
MTRVRTDAKGQIRRLSSGNIWMSAPTQEIVERMKERKLLEKNKLPWNPLPLVHLIPLPIKELII